MSARDFMVDALCAQTDPDMFIPDKGGPVAPAIRVCNRCDVRAKCLQYALDRNETVGIYGGLSAHQRRLLRVRTLKAEETS